MAYLDLTWVFWKLVTIKWLINEFFLVYLYRKLRDVFSGDLKAKNRSSTKDNHGLPPRTHGHHCSPSGSGTSNRPLEFSMYLKWMTSTSFSKFHWLSSHLAPPYTFWPMIPIKSVTRKNFDCGLRPQCIAYSVQKEAPTWIVTLKVLHLK